MDGIDFELVLDNTELIEGALDEAINIGLEAVGMQVEKYAKMLTPVDTGLLRNSITYAVSGKSPAISSYHASFGSNRISRGKNKGKRRRSSSANAGYVGIGSYSGIAPDEGDHAVYVGSNVEYAAYVEKGTKKSEAQPFLQPAIENHKGEYEKILSSQIKKTIETIVKD